MHFAMILLSFRRESPLPSPAAPELCVALLLFQQSFRYSIPGSPREKDSVKESSSLEDMSYQLEAVCCGCGGGWWWCGTVWFVGTNTGAWTVSEDGVSVELGCCVEAGAAAAEIGF